MLRSEAGVRKTGSGAICALMLCCALIPFASARQDSGTDSATKKSPTSKKTSSPKPHSAKASSAGTKSASTTSSKKRSRKKSARTRGQEKIDSERAQSIQEALIREHYLSGEASGTWNQASEEAMRRYQTDHGWQSKTVPDSRALISLGLGPNKDHLLNPESAMTTVPNAPRSESIPATSHSAPAPANPLPPASTESPVPSDPGSPQ